MPTRPRAKIGRHMLPGLAAAALFVGMATVFMGAQFPDALVETVGFTGSVTASIGYALLDLTGTMEGNVDGVVPSDGFLALLLIIAVLLTAALVGAVMLARRETGDSVGTALPDGGRRLVGGVAGRRAGDGARPGEPSSEGAAGADEDGGDA